MQGEFEEERNHIIKQVLSNKERGITNGPYDENGRVQ